MNNRWLMNDKNKKFKILIVDDERSNIVALASLLRQQYDIIVARDGETALEVAQKHIPDLILLDVIMPGINGFEVLVKLKNSGLTQKIPVIFITGENSAEAEEKGFFLGAVDYITKPFHNSTIEARVGTQLRMVKYIMTIERMGRIDALTNIPNRRAFDSQLNKEWGRAIREKKPLSILMIDIDKFKEYNDTHGHPQGDKLLKTVAGIFEQTLKRPSDLVSRWGGEEFAVLLPNTDLRGAVEVAEQIRANVEQVIVSCPNGMNTTVTVSIGVNTETPDTESQIENFISLADKALYAAKNSGRNKVVLADNI